MEDTRAYYLASKLYDGTISAAERQELDQWIAASPSRSSFLDEMALLLGPLTASVNAPVSSTDADWKSLRLAIASQQAPPAAVRKPALGWPRIAVAAAVALLVAFGAFWMLQGGPQPADSPLTFATKAGEQHTVTLADGSTVQLNGGSKLTLAAGFGKENRQLSLEGEAYFEVQKDPARPFEVSTGGVKTTVLGTKFNLRAYQPDASVRLSVVEGKVNFASIQSGAGQIFVANESGDFDAKRGTVQKIAVLPADAAAWRDGALVFVDEPLVEAVSRINQFYDIDLRLGSGLQDARLTTRFDAQQDEAAMLDVLATTYQARVRREGKTVWLEK
jgi:transmembrane sensor